MWTKPNIVNVKDSSFLNFYKLRICFFGVKHHHFLDVSISCDEFLTMQEI